MCVRKLTVVFNACLIQCQISYCCRICTSLHHYCWNALQCITHKTFSISVFFFVLSYVSPLLFWYSDYRPLQSCTKLRKGLYFFLLSDHSMWTKKYDLFNLALLLHAFHNPRYSCRAWILKFFQLGTVHCPSDIVGGLDCSLKKKKVLMQMVHVS